MIKANRVTRREAARRRLAEMARRSLCVTRRYRWRVVDNGIQVRLFLRRVDDRRQFGRRSWRWVSRTLATPADLTWLPDYLVKRRAELDHPAP